MARTLILGGGFGGIAAATTLRQLAPDHEVVLVDAGDNFSMGLRKLWDVFGISTLEEGSRPLAGLERHGIGFVQAQVEAIHPEAKAATAGGETLEADHLVVALGAQQRPDLVPGLAEHAHDVWDKRGVPALRAALADWQGGRIQITVAAAPYPCPPAPYECAFLLDEYLRDRGLRERTEIATTTLQPILMPNAGGEGSAWVAARLEERGIGYSTGVKLVSVDPGIAHFEGADTEFDLLIAVPPHRVPAPVADAGMTAEHGWIAVDRGTLATSWPDVFAVGDVTLIKLANGLPLPKAGVIAEAEGTRVGRAIAARIAGDVEPGPFTGEGQCFVEIARGEAAMVDGDFFAEPEPRVRLLPSSTEIAERKRRFEADLLARWFGQ